MPRNNMLDLRNLLFATLERLDDEDLSQEELKKEIDRAKAMSQVASVLVESAKVEVQAIRATGSTIVSDFLKGKEKNARVLPISTASKLDSHAS